MSGAAVFRMNFSHGTHDDQRKIRDIIRSVERKCDRPIAILADLQGPKLRRDCSLRSLGRRIAVNCDCDCNVHQLRIDRAWSRTSTPDGTYPGTVANSLEGSSDGPCLGFALCLG